MTMPCKDMYLPGSCWRYTVWALANNIEAGTGVFLLPPCASKMQQSWAILAPTLFKHISNSGLSLANYAALYLLFGIEANIAANICTALQFQLHIMASTSKAECAAASKTQDRAAMVLVCVHLLD